MCKNCNKALKAYEEATAPAEKAYEKAIARAWKAYAEACKKCKDVG